jgi:hypothetical protein
MPSCRRASRRNRALGSPEFEQRRSPERRRPAPPWRAAASDHCETFQRLRAKSACMHKPSLSTCAHASRRMTTLKSLQRQVLRATIVVTSAATVNYQKHSRIRFCGRRLGVLRSDTRTAGGAYGVPNGLAAPHRSSPPCYPFRASAGLRRERRSIIAGCGGRRSPLVCARFRSTAQARGRFAAVGRIVSMLAIPSCDRKDSHSHQRARTGGSSRHRSKKKQRPQGALTAFKRMTQQ